MGGVFPLISTPALIPAVVYGLIDTDGFEFCSCMAALSNADILSFFPTPGCVLGEYSSGGVLTTCAELAVDTTAQFCASGCYDGVARQLGVRIAQLGKKFFFFSHACRTVSSNTVY